MKKFLALGIATIVTITVSLTAFAGSNSAESASRGDHEGKPCHYVEKGSRERCHCRSCYGNNWGNYYCTRCNHSVNLHY